MAVEIRAPTVGVIAEVLVAEGDAVRAGQEIILLESMKIHVPLHAPCDGVVQGIRAERGDSIREGQVLVVLEKAAIGGE